MLGPHPFSHTERLSRAREIADKFRAHFDVLAIGLAARMARIAI